MGIVLRIRFGFLDMFKMHFSKDLWFELRGQNLFQQGGAAMEGKIALMFLVACSLLFLSCDKSSNRDPIKATFGEGIILDSVSGYGGDFVRCLVVTKKKDDELESVVNALKDSGWLNGAKREELTSKYRWTNKISNEKWDPELSERGVAFEWSGRRFLQIGESKSRIYLQYYSD